MQDDNAGAVSRPQAGGGMYVVAFTASSRVLVLRCRHCRLAGSSSWRCSLHHRKA